MQPPERVLISYLSEIKDRHVGFLSLDLDNGYISVVLDASFDLFALPCIFDDCSDAQARVFLEAFVQQKLNVTWELAIQLTKLLSKRGRLVSGLLDRLLISQDWSSYGSPLLLLSYLAVRDDGAALAIPLLDQVPEDGRDGLLLACHRLHSEALDRKLFWKFSEWGSGDWKPGGTGELHALEQFIVKWLKLYPYHDLEAVIRLFFKERDVAS